MMRAGNRSESFCSNVRSPSARDASLFCNESASAGRDLGRGGAAAIGAGAVFSESCVCALLSFIFKASRGLACCNFASMSAGKDRKKMWADKPAVIGSAAGEKRSSKKEEVVSGLAASETEVKGSR